MKNKTMIVSFAINDDNGNWEYMIRRADFGDIIDANPYDLPAQAEIHAGSLFVGWYKIPYKRRLPWYGSMAFEGFEIEVYHAQQLAEYLRKRGYVPESGDVEVWDAWQNEQPIIFSEASEDTGS